MKFNLTKTLQKAKGFTKPYLLTLSLFLMGTLSSTIYAADPFEKTNALGNQGITKVQGISIIIFGLAVVVTGLAYGIGGREVKAAIKKHWMSIAIGIVAVSAGPSIIEWATNFVKG